MHYSSDCGFPTFDQKVDVIGHQTVSVKEERQFALLDCQESEQLLIVVVIVENALSIVAARHDVVQSAFHF
jgi:hypothetical protein